MKDERLTELVVSASGSALSERFLQIDRMTGEDLDALASSLNYDWWRTSWEVKHKQAIMKHAVYLGWALVSILPEVLAEDEVAKGLADASAEEFVSMYEATGMAHIYGQIDSLPEGVLDILAQDFVITWWNPNADVDTKRAMFKSVYEVYRYIGTPSAVDKAAEASFENSSVTEWFDYGGKPYHFKVATDGEEGFPHADGEKADAFLRGMKQFKNVRSVLDAISFGARADVNTYAGIALAITDDITAVVIDEVTGAVLTDEDGNILTDENGGVLVL